MIQKTEVDDFLTKLKVKIKIFGIVFSMRDRCEETMRLLGISHETGISIILSLGSEDFLKKFEDAISWGDALWAFGKIYQGHNLYIKITLGFENRKPVCISFHEADYQMTYPLKNE